MTRGEHIRFAKHLLTLWREYGEEHPNAYDIAQAQVHATLALTAAPDEAPRSGPDPELAAAVKAIRSRAPRRNWWSRVVPR